jgi:hypothetical protein
VVVHNFDVVGVSFVPTKADAVLVVNPDAVWSDSVSFQRFEPVARPGRKIAQGSRGQHEPVYGLLLSDIAPNFVTLNVLHRNALNPMRHDCLAASAGNHKQLHDRVPVQTADPLSYADAIAFQQQFNTRFLQVIFDAEGFGVRFSESLTAQRAAKTLQPVAVLSSLRCFDPAIVASHCKSP